MSVVPAMTRRRFLAISAATALISPGVASAEVATWQGRALGGAAQMRIKGLSPAEAANTFRSIEQEIARLERIFSLYDPESEISRLNAGGSLQAPSLDLVRLLSIVDGLVTTTNGAFDPTIQPVWQAYAKAKSLGHSPSARDLSTARRLVGWEDVRFSPSEVRFEKPGMALTLNGIAQGFVTDRIAAFLQQHGLVNCLVDIGEIAALGSDWNVGVAGEGGRIVARVRLKDRALATSSPGGFILNRKDGIGHILDPRDGLAPSLDRVISVSSTTATIADGLSTVGCLMPKDDFAKAIETHAQTRLEVYI